MTIDLKAIEQYFPVILFVVLYKLIRIFQSVGEIVKCINSEESY